MNSVDIELACDSRFGLVFSKAEHPDTRDQHDSWIGITYRWRVRQRMFLVVPLVFLSIFLQGLVYVSAQFGSCARWIPRHIERPYLGADEVVRAARTQECELFRILRIYKRLNFRQVCEGADKPLLLGDAASQKREDFNCKGFVIVSHRVTRTTEDCVPFLLHVLTDELTELIDDRDGAQIALPLSVAPGE